MQQVRNRRRRIGRWALGVALLSLGLAAFMLRVWLGEPQVVGENVAKYDFFQGLPRVANIAHRGASSQSPEHSLEAYRLGLAQGAQILELDLRALRDGVLVVAHDADLRRTLGIDATLADLSLSELVHEAGPAAPQPLALIFKHFPATRFNLELKDSAVQHARTLAGLIDGAQASGRVLVASRHGEVIEEFRRVTNGRVPTSASAREVLKYYTCYLLNRPYAAAFAALQVPPIRWLGLDDAAFVRHAHRQRLFVHYWTVDDEKTMRSLALAGADGIMTNRPLRLTRVLGAVVLPAVSPPVVSPDGPDSPGAAKRAAAPRLIRGSDAGSITP